VQHFSTSRRSGTNRIEPDQFYLTHAARMIEPRIAAAGEFLFVYLAQNTASGSHAGARSHAGLDRSGKHAADLTEICVARP